MRAQAVSPFYIFLSIAYWFTHQLALLHNTGYIDWLYILLAEIYCLTVGLKCFIKIVGFWFSFKKIGMLAILGQTKLAIRMSGVYMCNLYMEYRMVCIHVYMVLDLTNLVNYLYRKQKVKDCTNVLEASVKRPSCRRRVTFAACKESVQLGALHSQVSLSCLQMMTASLHLTCLILI